ncbi:MAG: ABC transporter permease [Candidatus Eremiobacteraeota bacterium]|nr:ABC transporter permease [Candidatus Eremiobacteraeota bacterium]
MVSAPRRSWQDAIADVPFFGKYGALVVLLIVWELFAHRYKSYVLPAPSAIAVALVKGLGTAELWGDIGISVRRVFFGWGAASVVAILFGFLMSSSRLFREQFAYLVRMLQPVPGIAWIGITIIWFGLNEMAIIGVIFLTVLPLVTVATYEGFLGVDREYQQAARTLGARSEWAVFTSVTVRAALPYLLNGLNIGFGQAWRVLAAAELVGATSGLGYFMQVNQTALRTENVFVVIILFTILMFAFERLIYQPVQRKVLGRWSRV